MITIKEKDSIKKEHFKDLAIGDFFVYAFEKRRGLYLKGGSDHAISLINGQFLIINDNEKIVPVKNVDIEYEV